MAKTKTKLSEREMKAADCLGVQHEDFAAGVERLQASMRGLVERESEEATVCGRDWAMNHASAEDLMKLKRASDEGWSMDDAIAAVIIRSYDDAEEFWKLSGQEEIPSEVFITSFAESAVHFWNHVEDLL